MVQRLWSGLLPWTEVVQGLRDNKVLQVPLAVNAKGGDRGTPGDTRATTVIDAKLTF